MVSSQLSAFISDGWRATKGTAMKIPSVRMTFTFFFFFCNLFSLEEKNVVGNTHKLWNELGQHGKCNSSLVWLVLVAWKQNPQDHGAKSQWETEVRLRWKNVIYGGRDMAKIWVWDWSSRDCGGICEILLSSRCSLTSSTPLLRQQLVMHNYLFLVNNNSSEKTGVWL